MFGYIKGDLIWNDTQTVTIMNQAGFGLRIFVNTPTRATIIQQEKDVELFLHTRVTQDNQALFGFEQKSQLDFFEQLLGINGVGPKLALEILALPTSEVIGAIEKEDIAFLKTIKGLGKKTAERLILELSGKLPELSNDESDANSSSRSSIPGDVIIALENLGYKRKHIMQVFENMNCGNLSESEIIKQFLQNV